MDNQFTPGEPDGQDPQPQFQQQPYQAPPPPQKGGKGIAVTSMVLGIVATVFSCCAPYITVLLSIAALVLGIVVLVKQMDGKGMAIAGIALGGVSLIMGALLLAWLIAVFGSIWSEFPWSDGGWSWPDADFWENFNREFEFDI
jgi:hypothetical protein